MSTTIVADRLSSLKTYLFYLVLQYLLIYFKISTTQHLAIMNEEQAVLDFFAQPENLPLGLSVAEQIDTIREQMNSRFWQELQQHFAQTNHQDDAQWKTGVIEDRNSAGILVGLQFKLPEAQDICLFPIMEQQYLGGGWRIFFGLMWQSKPTAEQLALPAVAALLQALDAAGFKDNESFLGWQWTNYYPRRSDFLLRYSRHPEALLQDMQTLFNSLVLNHRELIAQANTALKVAPRSMTISLDQLRRKRSDQGNPPKINMAGSLQD